MRSPNRCVGKGLCQECNALENAALNGFGSKLQLLVGCTENIGAATFDLIVANIDRNNLLAFAGGLGKNLRRGGRLFLSGLQAEDLADISSALQAGGGRVSQTRKRDEWLALEAEFEVRR